MSSTPAKPYRRAKNADTPENTSKYYLTNGRLLPEVIKAKGEGKLTNELAMMLMMLTKKYAQRPCFSGYTYKEDMISEALTNLCQNALKFNPEKSSNPFAYYTTCINSSFLQFLNVEKKHRRIRDQLLIDLGENPSYSFQDDLKRSEFKEELTDLRVQIGEAKERMEKDAIEAAKRAAQVAAEAEQERLAAVATLEFSVNGTIVGIETIDIASGEVIEQTETILTTDELDKETLPV